MILSCQGICKSFGDKVILKDASFHIEEREKAALVGSNGAGKTTLLRIIMQKTAGSDIWRSTRISRDTARSMRSFSLQSSIFLTWSSGCVPLNRK